MREFNIIAVDFDGTLCTDCYPEIGEPNDFLIAMLKNLKTEGKQLILWTCRAGEDLEHAVSWCREKGLVFDQVNENVPEIIARYGGNSRKIFADVYLDEKGCFPWVHNSGELLKESN